MPAWSCGVLSGPGGGGVLVSQHALRADPSLCTEFLTHASDNITLPQTSSAGGNKRHMKTYFIVKDINILFLVFNIHAVSFQCDC